jgi:deoxyribonuclease-4
MSIAGGLHLALQRGVSIGCSVVQMFVKSSNRWAVRDLAQAEIAAFRQARRDTGMRAVVAHAAYLLNLGSPDDTLWTRSVDAAMQELRRCQALGIDRWVLHPGAHMGSGQCAGLERAAQGLTVALEATADAEVVVLLEVTAGQGTSLGHTWEQLAWLLGHVEPPERLGICFDTAHALAAGYEFRDAASYRAMWSEFDSLIGRERLGAIHLNDSKRDKGDHVDRHEQLGKGFLGLESFRLLLHDPALRQVPMILETPKGPDLQEDIENLALLRSLLAEPDGPAKAS